MASDYNYCFTQIAEKDFDEILSYISNDLCNSSAAKNFYIKVFDSIERICTYPDMGENVTNKYLQDNSIRKILIDNYFLYYKYISEENCIYIVRIIYAPRNQENILKTIDKP
jgi:plasmid stabilization system protein ParE